VVVTLLRFAWLPCLAALAMNVIAYTRASVVGGGSVLQCLAQHTALYRLLYLTPSLCICMLGCFPCHPSAVFYSCIRRKTALELLTFTGVMVLDHD